MKGQYCHAARESARRALWQALGAGFFLVASVAALSAEPVLFGDRVVPVEIEVGTNSLESLRRVPLEFQTGHLRVGGVSVYSIGVRFQDGTKDGLFVGKPQLVVRLDPDAQANDVCGARCLRLSCWPREPGGLGPFMASRMAAALGVSAPRVGHVALQVNGQYLGAYVCQEVPEGEMSGSRAGSALDRLRAGANRSDQASRLATLESLVDVPGLCRLLAWEVFLTHCDGYLYGGTNTLEHVEAGRPKVCLGARELPSLFRDTGAPVLIATEASAAAILMESGAGRWAYLEQLDTLANNTALLASLSNAIQGRAAALQPLMVGLKEAGRLRREAEGLQRWLDLRAASVRRHVRLLAARPELATMPLPVRRVYRLGQDTAPKPGPTGTNALPAFEEGLTKEPGVWLQTGPKVYEFSLGAETGILEKLHWSATNWVDVSLSYRGTAVSNVTLRLRGHGTRQSFLAKPSFTLRFNSRAGSQLLGGISKLHFHNALYDPSFLNQYTGHWLFTRAGLAAPEVGFAHVTVNGKDLGLFVTVQGANKAFLRQGFGDDQGLLFEGEFQDIHQGPHLDSGRMPEGYGDLLLLAEAARRAATWNTMEELGAWVDVRHLASFVALENILGHRDGYTLEANNYRVYQPSVGGRFYWIPHGMDWLVPQGEDPLFPTAKGIVAKAVLQTSAGRREYCQCLGNILTNVLNPDDLALELGRTSRLLQPILRRADPLQAERQVEAARTLAQQLRSRRDRLLGALAGQSRSSGTNLAAATPQTRKTP